MSEQGYEVVWTGSTWRTFTPSVPTVVSRVSRQGQRGEVLIDARSAVRAALSADWQTVVQIAQRADVPVKSARRYLEARGWAEKRLLRGHRAVEYRRVAGL